MSILQAQPIDDSQQTVPHMTDQLQRAEEAPEDSLTLSSKYASTSEFKQFLSRTFRSQDSGVDRRVAELRLGLRVEDNFRWIFKKYYRSVWAFFFNCGVSPSDCEDLSQEVFIRVYRGLKNFRGEAKFETWLSRIAGNVFLNRIRDQSTQKRGASELSWDEAQETDDSLESELAVGALSAEPSPQQNFLTSERKTQLLKAIGDLPPQMRQCLALRLVSNCKYREIAEIMDISIDAVKSHLAQGRARLKERLTEVFKEQ